MAEKVGHYSLPEIQGRTLWVSSDYSFGNVASRYDVIALLLADPESSFGWEDLRTHVRSEHLGDRRRMSWKGLNDKRRQQAFFPFLQAADHINGLCVAIAIQRDPAFRISSPELLTQYQGRPWLNARWSSETLEQAVRIAYFTALFVAGLSSPGQDILWISDQDPVFANAAFSQNVGVLFTKLLNLFSSHSFGQISIGTTAITELDMLEEDLSSIPDLVAGAACEILTAIKKEYGQIPRIAVEMPVLSVRASNFLRWFKDGTRRLKRRLCLIERRSNGALSGGILCLS